VLLPSEDAATAEAVTVDALNEHQIRRDVVVSNAIQKQGASPYPEFGTVPFRRTADMREVTLNSLASLKGSFHASPELPLRPI
jgi:hypothetical protein